jgi:hypothetical protein
VVPIHIQSECDTSIRGAERATQAAEMVEKNDKSQGNQQDKHNR